MRSRTRDLIRAEGEGVLQRVSVQLSTAGLSPAQSEGLAQALEPAQAAETGVLWMALVSADGRILTDAGDPGSLSELPPQPGALVVGKGRARLMVSLPSPRSEQARSGPGAPPVDTRRAPPRLVIDFEPTLARDLQTRTERAMMASVVGAFVLVGLALWSTRARTRIEAAERELARTRHLASLGQMSAVLAHELRNPLTALKGHAQLLVEGAEPGRKQRRAERVVRNVERLQSRMDDLLSFARSAEVQRMPVTVRGPIEAAMEGLDASRFRIEGDVAGSFPLDAARMAQVLANLMSNALQHAPEESSVEVRIHRSPDALVYSVRDRGPGVPEDQRERIFEPFVTGRQQGTGLGLAVARRICELHGGTLTMAPAEGGGARFTARIPEV
ncbi:MAG: two-component sensor histidine kinase [Deltaproteobacteria bacterium]|nr:two-component sensor histidine kinase [Deltaproteobacteria bacterium]HCH62512.1 two-component sensor histidine kinase [Deltaproteobacteria bacterium]